MTPARLLALEGGQLPELPAHFVGRDETTRLLRATLAQRHLLSIVGPGGLGKTTLAVAVARQLGDEMRGGVCFLDLARLSAGDLLDAELAIALDMESPRDVTHEHLLSALSGQHMLLVLDSCEAVVDAVAELVEDLAACAPELLILVTSREPLRARGEWVHLLAPLTSPPEAAVLPVWLAMTYPAVQLFFSVAQSRDAGFSPTPDTLALATALCAQLDGSPLGITVVASHLGRLGLQGMQGVRADLEPELLRLGADGQVDRHRSLEAVLDWSYRLLRADEQRAFRALSCLRGRFDLEVAASVVGGRADDAMNLVLDLAAKSLLMTVQVGDTTLYRMPDLTRAYAGTRLAQAGAAECRAARKRHAQALRLLLSTAEQRWNFMSRAEWRRAYGAWIEDVRHALQWAFSTEGEALLGIELTVAVVLLADHTGLFAGFDEFASRALHEVSLLQPARPDLALRLHIFPALDQLRAIRNAPQHIETLAKALEIGSAAGTVPAQLGATLALWSHSFQFGNYRKALERSASIQQLADEHGDAVATLTARRTRAQSLHFLGDHASARVLALGVLAQVGQRIPLAYTPSPISLDVSMRILLARIHWIEGRAQQAWQTVQACLAHAEQDTPAAMCQTLAIAAIPVALWCGRLGEGAEWNAQLLDHASRYDYPFWRTWARLIEVALNPATAAQPAQSEALKTLPSVEQTLYCDHLGTFEPDTLASSTLARAQSGEAGWCAPEVLRVRAEHAAAVGSPQALTEASAWLSQARKVARAQGALAWELRIALSAVRLSWRSGAADSSLAALRAVRGRFSEGFETRDLRLADELLAGS